MLLLVAFALIAGFATCLSPCVLPVLPVVLTAGSAGGRKRPLGIATGLVLSFTFSTVAFVYLIAALGLPNDLLRTLAIFVLVGFGVSLIIPALSSRVEGWLSRFSYSPRGSSDGGFVSGLPLGIGLGFLYAPCAGPILAGVITVSAAQTFTAARLAVALAYAVGSAFALYLIMRGGRRFTRRLMVRSARIQQAMGVLMLVIAVLVFAQVDVRFQTAIASKLPGFLTSPAQKLQQDSAVAHALGETNGHKTVEAAGEREADSGQRLPELGTAPEFRNTQRWFNTPGSKSLTMSGLRGRVVLVDFWTYTCINCIRTFPHLKALDAKYRKYGLTIVGVHSPEFPFEKDASNVEASIKQNGLRYPVVQDNNHATWNAYKNQFWPADYLVDANGHVRYVHFGEGDYQTSEKAVRSLLEEAGRSQLGGMTQAHVQVASPGLRTPETYLGAARAEGFIDGPIEPGTQDFGRRLPKLFPNTLAYARRWTITNESATARASAALELNFTARRVFLVLGSPGRARTMQVLLDGKPVPKRLAGRDVHDGAARIKAQRLYRLIDLPRVERHVLILRPERGISGYAFTFG